MADPAYDTGPARGHSLDNAHRNNMRVLNGPARTDGKESALSRWLTEEIASAGTKRSDLEHLLPAKALRQIKDMSPPNVAGDPSSERFRAIIIATVIETALHDTPNLDSERLRRHAEQERELAGLFKQLLDAQRKEGRY